MITKQMQLREFDILSDAQMGFTPADAICQFLYKGYQISISTAGRSKGACQTPICIYTGVEYQDVYKDDFSTVREAIEYIDRTLKS